MQSLTEMWELKVNEVFCLPWQRHPHQLLLLAVNCEALCSNADVAGMSFYTEQKTFRAFHVPF